MVAAISLAPSMRVSAQTPKFALGVRGGVAKLEGDFKVTQLTPEFNTFFSYWPWPHLGISAEAGFADLQLGANADTAFLRTVPLALNFTFRFSPYAKVTPFASLSGGGAFWQHFSKNTDEAIPLNGQTDKNFDNFVGAAGGLDIFFSPRITWTIGASYRHYLTDQLDFASIGDQRDGVISAFTGFSVNFGKIVGDGDQDGVIDRYDLDSNAKEDHDGYLDHDGVPDSQISGNVTALVDAPNADGGGADKTPPVVIHSPVQQATINDDIHLRAEIFENQRLLKAAVLYRPANVRRWLVEPMNSVDGNLFIATIPRIAVSPVGVEYCVVAVDDAISGVGYSGLPARPNFVRVHGKETWWRIATTLAAIGGWGAAGYLVFREQQ
jgi:hypothetical protein